MSENKLKHVSDDDLVYLAGRIRGSESAESAQAELTRRLMESIKKFDTTTSDYTKRLIGLTVLLFFVAAVQLVVTAFALPFDLFNRILIALSIVVLLVWIIKDVAREFISKGGGDSHN